MGLSQIFDQVGANIELDRSPTWIVGSQTMSALGQKQTFALHQHMSALPPIATSIAFFDMSALGQKRTSRAYSINSSARPISVFGMLIPSAFAVLRLIISSTFADCWTGRSEGFSPFRILPA